MSSSLSADADWRAQKRAAIDDAIAAHAGAGPRITRRRPAVRAGGRVVGAASWLDHTTTR